ncbi:Wzz/FepE/Etk N-terminal domain-containing protein [Marichromatium gracile]|uniref:Polysaccharide chain length determinant N-terminal domain-containing protein n=1 Tax=Marichromatium gracile TaxID=1048 RepID=A0ABR5VL61_MARGR|nr:Wzz/FepE/Etk N-terminal domain-containing protein [Marichromatium gracile]KXX66456.1 hypothetical protein AY586_00625 [Marichromatium gracile]
MAASNAHKKPDIQPAPKPDIQPAPAPQPLPFGLEDEIDLIEYLVTVFRNKHWIMLFALLCAIAAYGMAKTMPDRYEASVQLALRQPDDPGGISPDNRRAPEALTLMEHSFVLRTANENYRHIVMAKMRSRSFGIDFIQRHDLLPHLFAEHWDREQQQWIEGFTPDIDLAFKIFSEQVRSLVHNPENDLLRLYIRWQDPRIAAEWANDYVQAFNDYMREQTITESRRKRAFLLEQLKDTRVVEVEKSLYRMIEAETALEVLARARDNYVLQVLDAAVPPEHKFSPSVKRLTLLGLFGGFGLGIAVAIGSVLVRKIRKAMAAYREKSTNG